MSAKQIYLGILIFFFVLGSIFNILVFRKKRGIQPITFWRTDSRVERYIGLIFLTSVIFYVFGGTLLVVCPAWVDWLHGFRLLDHWYVNLLGFLLCLASMVVISLAQRTMGASWRIGIDSGVSTDLVTSGIFQYSRNPIFTGMIVLTIGIFLIVPNVIPLLWTVVTYFAINVQIRLEEDFLEKVHGDKFRDYCKQVGRFLPRLKKVYFD